MDDGTLEAQFHHRALQLGGRRRRVRGRQAAKPAKRSDALDGAMQHVVRIPRQANRLGRIEILPGRPTCEMTCIAIRLRPFRACEARPDRRSDGRAPGSERISKPRRSSRNSGVQKCSSTEFGSRASYNPLHFSLRSTTHCNRHAPIALPSPKSEQFAQVLNSLTSRKQLIQNEAAQRAAREDHRVDFGIRACQRAGLSDGPTRCVVSLPNRRSPRLRRVPRWRRRSRRSLQTT